MRYSATLRRRKFAPDVWACDCGHKEASKAKMDRHLHAHSIWFEASRDKEEDDRLRREAEEDKRLRERDAAQRRWREAVEAAQPTDEPVEVASLREQIQAAVEKARSEGYEQALIDAFERGESMTPTEPGLAVMSLVAEMLEEHRAVQSL